MYKRTATIGELYGYVFLDNKIYTHRKKVGKIQELSLLGDVIWESNEKDIWNYYVHGNYILFNLYDDDEIFDDTYLYNRLTKELIFNEKLQLYCILNQECYKDNILYDVKNNEVILFDLSKGKIIKEVVAKTSGRVSFISDYHIVKNDNSYIYIYSKSDFSLLWQKDLSNFLKYDSEGKEQQGQIKQVKQYKDSLIVVSDGGVLRLALETGEIIWKAEGYTRTMEIVGNMGYCCSSLSLWKLDLETGQESGYGWEHHRLPDIEWNGRTYWPGGHEVIYHGGLLWYSVFISGHSFLLAINPHDGHYEWVHHVETNEKTGSPKFHGDKMFLLDTGNTLHIYEKESKEISKV